MENRPNTAVRGERKGKTVGRDNSTDGSAGRSGRGRPDELLLKAVFPLVRLAVDIEFDENVLVGRIQFWPQRVLQLGLRGTVGEEGVGYILGAIEEIEHIGRGWHFGSVFRLPMRAVFYDGISQRVELVFPDLA